MIVKFLSDTNTGLYMYEQLLVINFNDKGDSCVQKLSNFIPCLFFLGTLYKFNIRFECLS